MNSRRTSLSAALVAALFGTAAAAQTLQDQQPPKSNQLASKSDTPSSETQVVPSARADAYYNYAMAHLFEQQYETTNQPEFATQAIEAYKKAYSLDPKSPVIGERLAEMYWKANRSNEAVTEAQELLKRDPSDLPTRRLLGRIYLRKLEIGRASCRERV